MTLQTTPPVSPETLANWQAELDKHFPKTENTSHLKLVWVSGDDWEIDGVWQGVERFYCFEMIPAEFVHPDLIAEVKDGPRPVVRYDTVTKTVARSLTMSTRLQWDLYRESVKDGGQGFYGKPFWVLQGDKGGHQRFFTQLEKKFLQLASLPTDPPLPGTLPYAPFDNRVLRQLLKHDRLRKIDGRFALMRETRSAEYKRHQAALERGFREKIVEFLRDQIDMETAKDVLRHDRDNLEVKDTDYSPLIEEAESRFIETGSV